MEGGSLTTKRSQKWKRRKKTKEERRAEREQRRRRWHAARVASDGGRGCCLKHGMKILLWTNILFVILGAGLVGMGIYGTQSVFAEMFGSGPGLAVIAMGFACMLTALCGHVGAKRDNKCLLLIYFIVLFCALCTLTAMGSTVLFDQQSINDKFSGWWEQFPTQAEQGQAEFDCCGYADPADRPMADCELEADADTPGCKQIGLDYMNARFVPLFLLAFVSGVAMFVALCVSVYLLCRSTLKHVNEAHLEDTDAADLASLNKFVPLDVPAGGADEAKLTDV